MPDDADAVSMPVPVHHAAVATRPPPSPKNTLETFLDQLRQDLRQASRARHHRGEDARDVLLRSQRLGNLRVRLARCGETFDASVPNVPQAFHAMAVTLEDGRVVLLVRPRDKDILPFWMTVAHAKDATDALAFLVSTAGPSALDLVH